MVGLYAARVVSHPYDALGTAPIALARFTMATNLGSVPVSALDALSGATPLDAFKHKGDAVLAGGSGHHRRSRRHAEYLAQYRAGMAGRGRGVDRQAADQLAYSVAMLGSVMLLSALFYANDTSHFGSPLFHLVTGATLFGAFFIATDPVSAATSRQGSCYTVRGLACWSS